MIMKTFKETYINANHSVIPSGKLVENTRMKMHTPSTKSNVNKFYKKNTFRLASAIVCSFLFLAGIAVLVINISNRKESSFPFNKIDNIYSTAPLADAGIYSVKITTEETEKYLGYSLTECLPESLSSFSTDYSGLYDEDNHLLGLSVSLVQNLSESPQGKGFYCEIVDTSVNTGTLTIDYSYSDTTMEKGDILGTKVVALERPGYLEVNDATGYKKEIPAVYIAEFTAGTNYYYIEARERITKSEMIQFVTSLIQNAKTK